MKYCSVSISKLLYPTLNKFTRRSLVAAEIATMSYFADVKANIRILAERLIETAKTSTNEEVLGGAKIRKRSLARFMKGSNPLSFNVQVYPDLIRSVNPFGSHMSLQIGETQSMSTLELASIMYNITKPTNPLPLQAPFFPNSHCVGVFRVAVAFISRQAALGQVGDIPAFVMNILAMMFDEKQICHVPWYASPAPNAIGRPAKKVVFDHYRSTSKLQEMGERAMMQVVDAESEALMADARLSASAALKDAKSPWCINSLTIGELPTIMHKQTLPSDFSIKHASLGKCDPYITETYEWVVKNYNGSLPIHKFALLVALMFSRVAPNLGHPPPPSNLRTLGQTRNGITAHVRSAPWIAHETGNNKGCIAALPFIVMVTTAIIAMADVTSPLRKYVKATSNIGTWSRKHCEFCACFLTARSDHLCAHP